MSGLSERTIQRVEKGGRFSLSTKAALAKAFAMEPGEFESAEPQVIVATETGSAVQSRSENEIVYHYDWAGALGLLILGLCIPAIVLLTGTHGLWELASFALVMGLTLTKTLMNHGLRATYRLFDNTSWIVRHPSYVKDIDNMIVQGKSVIGIAYGVAVIVSLVSAITLAVHSPQTFSPITQGLVFIVKPLVYAILFVEFWFRPYVRKMEKMQSLQQPQGAGLAPS